MTAQLLKCTLTKGLHLLVTATLIATFIAALIVSGGLFSTARTAQANATIAIVDTLGAATPGTRFSVFGSAGTTIDRQIAGPVFTLTERTVITEIGGFVNNCRDITEGTPLCPITLPFIVQIRPSINGVPDASVVLASFVLSHDDDPLVVSYESVATNLPLPAGSYFALFVSQGDDAGFLLSSAHDPFAYQAVITTIGVLDPTTEPFPIHQLPAAVRILGRPSPVITPSIAIKSDDGPNPIRIKQHSNGKIPVAILSAPGFDAPAQVNQATLTFGRTGDEESLHWRGHNTPNCGVEDMNKDGRLDLICHFYTRLTGFEAGDTEGILKGKTLDGTPMEGRDSVRIISR
jgi:hypothetical protein